MGVGESLVRTLMFVFNAVFFLLGVGLAVIGGLVVGARYIGELQDAFPSDIDVNIATLTYAGGAILAFGVVVMIVSFLGCCGALRHSKCMLYTYAVFMSVFVLAQVVIGILAFVYRSQIKDSSELREAVFDTLKKTNTSDDQSVMEMWNVIQEGLECCGVNSSADWVAQPGTPFTGRPEAPFYPDSCCSNFYKDCASGDKPVAAFTKGCYQAIYDQVDSYGLMIGLGAIIFALLQVLGIVFACCLGQSAD